MDHLETRELLELAAVEPGGLDRLMAGDMPTAGAIAGHLAGCDACTQEFSRLRASSRVLRGVISTMPPPELRHRTLAMVAALGRPRGAGASAAEGARSTVVADAASFTPASPADVRPAPVLHVVPSLGEAADSATGRDPAPAPVRADAASSGFARRRRGGRLAWLAAAAALVIVTAGTTGYVVSTTAAASARQASAQLEGLTEVASWTARLDAQPDVRRVVLAATAPAGSMQEIGTLVFSAATRQVVVVADGMPMPPSGQEYRCWVEIAGNRQRLGKMYLSGTLAYWVGDSDVLASVPAGSVFGVSLADIAGGGSSPAILSGTLQTT